MTADGIDTRALLAGRYSASFMLFPCVVMMLISQFDFAFIMNVIISIPLFIGFGLCFETTKTFNKENFLMGRLHRYPVLTLILWVATLLFLISDSKVFVDVLAGILFVTASVLSFLGGYRAEILRSKK